MLKVNEDPAARLHQCIYGTQAFLAPRAHPEFVSASATPCSPPQRMKRIAAPCRQPAQQHREEQVPVGCAGDPGCAQRMGK